MWAGLKRVVRGRHVLAAATSLALHLLLAALVVLVGAPAARYTVRRGEPLFVELPELPGPAPAGNPAAGPPRRQPPVVPAPRPPRESRPSRPAAPPPPVVASRPEPPPPPPPRSPEPAPRSAEPAPEPPKAEVREPSGPEAAPAESRPATPRAAPAPSPSPSPAPTVATPGGAAPEPPGPRVAAVPPGRQAPPIDIRAALGRGAGGRGGRGGIEGEPVPLDSRDPKYSDYLDRVRRMIKERWGYPCVKHPGTGECEYKSAQLVVEFGIAKDGKVPFVTVMRSSGWTIYDDYAVNAIKLAAPFPPVPDAISLKGIPILATFNYVVDTSLTNLLR